MFGQAPQINAQAAQIIEQNNAQAAQNFIAEDDIPLAQIIRNDNEIPISVLIKLIKPFSGDKKYLNSFIRNCQSAHDLASNYQKPIIFTFICAQLNDKAELAILNHDFKRWPELKSFLLECYSEKNNYGHLQMELQACRQYFNENITDFIQRVETCTTRLLQSVRTLSTDDSELKGRFATIELISLQTFITGVRPEFSLILRAREPTSLSEAYDVALNEEKSIAFIKQQGHRTNPSGRHDIQKTNFHRTQNSLSTSNSYYHSQPRVPFIKKQTVFQTNSNTNQNSYRSKFCHYCKNNGHIISECRKLEYNNKRRQQIQNTHTNLQNSTTPNSQNFSQSRDLNQIRTNPTVVLNIKKR